MNGKPEYSGGENCAKCRRFLASINQAVLPPKPIHTVTFSVPKRPGLNLKSLHRKKPGGRPGSLGTLVNFSRCQPYTFSCCAASFLVSFVSSLLVLCFLILYLFTSYFHSLIIFNSRYGVGISSSKLWFFCCLPFTVRMIVSWLYLYSLLLYSLNI